MEISASEKQTLLFSILKTKRLKKKEEEEISLKKKKKQTCHTLCKIEVIHCVRVTKEAHYFPEIHTGASAFFLLEDRKINDYLQQILL